MNLRPELLIPTLHHLITSSSLLHLLLLLQLLHKPVPQMRYSGMGPHQRWRHLDPGRLLQHPSQPNGHHRIHPQIRERGTGIDLVDGSKLQDLDDALPDLGAKVLCKCWAGCRHLVNMSVADKSVSVRCLGGAANSNVSHDGQGEWFIVVEG